MVNGKKNGKGKEYYYDSSIIFEGEYTNGDIIRGKHYDRRGKILFEGEYLNGKRWNGIEKEYDTDGVLKIEYEYLNGLKKI